MEGENKLLYVAEKKNTEETHDGAEYCRKVLHTHEQQHKLPQSYFHTLTVQKMSERPVVCVIIDPKQDRSVYCEDWGEGLSDKSVPVLCVVDLHNGTVRVLQGSPPDVSPGQVRTENLTSASDTDGLFWIICYKEFREICLRN